MTKPSVNKLFCIGLNKTGTTSLHSAFQILGLKSVHHMCPAGNIKEIVKDNYSNKRALLTGIDDYDAISDWNDRDTNHLYKMLDEQYPGSKFILNTRNLDAWLASRERHVLRTPNLTKLQKQFPDHPWYNIDKETWKNDFQELHEEVSSYFKDRPGDLLIIDVPAGDGWEKLCPFLSVPIPRTPFPHGNQSGRTNSIIRMLRKARRKFRNARGKL